MSYSYSLPDFSTVNQVRGNLATFYQTQFGFKVFSFALPTPDALDKYRMKAARSNALAFRALFYSNKIDYTCGDGCCLVEADGGTTAISLDIIGRYKEGCVFKSLWSGSGKGLCW